MMLRVLPFAAVVAFVFTSTAVADGPATPEGDLLIGALTPEDAKRAEELEKLRDLEMAGRYEESIRAAEELLALRAERQGPDHWETRSDRWVLDRIRRVAGLPDEKRLGWQSAVQERERGIAARCAGEYARSRPLKESYRRWCEDILGENHPETAISYGLLAYLFDVQGEYARAAVLHEKSLRILRDTLGDESPHTAMAQRSLGSHLMMRGRYADALPYLRRAATTLRNTLGDSDQRTALAMGTLGTTLRLCGKHADARPVLEAELASRRKAYGDSHPDTNIAYLGLAQCLQSLGLYADAQPHFEKALLNSRAAIGDSHPDIGMQYDGVAGNLANQGKREAAHVYYLRALEIHRELLGERHPRAISSYIHVAANLDSLGRYADSQSLYLKALDLAREGLGEDHPNTISCYGGLATILESQGKWDEAAPLRQRALDACRDLLGERHPSTASNYFAMAINRRARGRHVDARPLFERAFELTREIYGEKHPEIAGVLRYRALNLGDQQRQAEAEPLFAEALAIYRGRFESSHPGIVTLQFDLARCLEHQDKPAPAQPILEDALGHCRALFGQHHPTTAYAYVLLASNLMEQGNYADALPLLERSAAGFEAARLYAAGRGLERAEFGEWRSPYGLLAAARLRGGDVEGAWAAREAGLARGLSDEYAFRSSATLSPDVAARRSDLTARLNELHRRILDRHIARSSGAANDGELERLLEERRTVDAELAELAVSISRRELAALSDVQSALPGNSAIVLWLDALGGAIDEHWGCVIRSSGPPRWERLRGRGPDGAWTDEDWRLPGRFWRALSGFTPSSLATVDRLAGELRAQRFAPLEKHLEGVNSIHVVAVESMSGIPVETLCRDRTISYLPSGAYLVRARARAAPAGTRVLALGDPTFAPPESTPVAVAETRPSDAVLATLRGRDWAELPATRAELARLTALFGPDRVTLLTDAQASERRLDELRLRGELERFRYLHFATHGEGTTRRAFESELILAQDGDSGDSVPRPGEPFVNGRLSAREVLEFWKLDSELVTLSACETGWGRSGGGEGMLGFAQAFLTAGSRSVCLSLWEVDDAATALLMSRFYENLLGRRAGLVGPMPRGAALAEAKRWLRELSAEDAARLASHATEGVLRSGRGKGETLRLAPPAADESSDAAKRAGPFAHPQHWAAFILIGDPD